MNYSWLVGLNASLAALWRRSGQRRQTGLVSGVPADSPSTRRGGGLRAVAALPLSSVHAVAINFEAFNQPTGDTHGHPSLASGR
ncbi:MAG: hypothetical protein ABI907_10770, partial [Ramlibacter sp.]